MQSLSQIRALLAERGLRPRHRLGQNFLHDHNQIRRLLEAAAIEPGDLVLEVGPGTGTLTGALLDAGAVVVASELDDEMASIVEAEFADDLGGRLTVIRGDCLAGKHAVAPALLDALERVGRSPDGVPAFKLVANLPYQAATPLMLNLLTAHSACRGQFVTIQREVADRLLARPNTRAYGPLAVIASTMAVTEMLAVLPPSCFWPAPKVTSAMVSIRPLAAPGVDAPRAFSRFLLDLFSMRRKQIGTILGRDLVLPDGIDPTARPESLDPDQLVMLWRVADTDPDVDAPAS